jgi:hypothetical protein
MAVYLFNLGFSFNNAQYGNFAASGGGQTGLNQSNTWFQYNGQNLPPGVSDNVVALGALTPTDWTVCPAPTQFNAGSDYIILRIFNTDTFSPAPTLRLRLTAVMGRGNESNGLPAGTNLQAPFMADATHARPVIDCDGTSGTNWPLPTGTDGAWTYCIGEVHGVTNDYSLNIGASAWSSNGLIGIYGVDPHLHVVGGSMGQTEETCKAVA